MAKPQLEDGHTRIPNEILEHLMKMHLAPNQWQVLMCIIRKTSGWHKKVDYIANFQIVAATGLCTAVVSRCLKSLSEKQMITRKGKLIGFQEDWERWRELAEPSTLASKLAEPSTEEKLAIPSTELTIASTELAISSKKVSSCAVTQKKKETIQKKLYKRKKRNYFFDNILLLEEEYQKLIKLFGEGGTKDRLETLSLYKKSKGRKYSSDYATILAWEKRDKKGGQNGTYPRHPRQVRPRGTYTRPGDYRD